MGYNGRMRFVLLYHDCPGGYVRPSHWDLMLESGGVLRTWALPRLPAAWCAARLRTAELYPACAEVANENRVVAERLADHRVDYLEYEGAVRGERGEVRRVDAGEYVMVEDGEEELRVEVLGEFIRGVVEIGKGEMIVGGGVGGMLSRDSG